MFLTKNLKKKKILLEQKKFFARAKFFFFFLIQMLYKRLINIPLKLFRQKFFFRFLARVRSLLEIDNLEIPIPRNCRYEIFKFREFFLISRCSIRDPLNIEIYLEA